MNHLLEILPRKDRAATLAICEPRPLALGTILYEPGRTTRHVYFPTEGFVSLVARVEGTPGLEVGMVGSEGMLGSHLVLGVADVSTRALVQGEGTALRAGAADFRQALADRPVLRRCLGRYVHVRMSQLAGIAPCLRFHLIDARLARWLLMSQDRAHRPVFKVTQDFLSYMLGVRRAGVTRAAIILQQAGLIHYSRGTLTVLDRRGLEAASCACYAADRASYTGLLGDAFPLAAPEKSPTARLPAAGPAPPS